MFVYLHSYLKRGHTVNIYLMKENEMVFGIRAVIEAIQADKEIDKILVKRELQGELSP